MSASDDCTVWLYGSHARGDADRLSDVDVLVVSDLPIDDGPIPSIACSPSPLSIARYSWAEIEGMAEYGSLFLRHVQLEGRVLCEGSAVRGRLGAVLSSLPQYSLALRDLEGFRAVLADVENSLGSDAHLTFELATVATLFRHACILGCAVSGNPCFSRFEPVTRVVRHWALASNWPEEFPELYAYRMYAEGRSERRAKPSHDMARVWCDRAGILLGELRVQIHERN